MFATRLVSSETNKRIGGQVPTMVLLGTRSPQLLGVVREGQGSAVRLSARGTQCLAVTGITAQGDTGHNRLPKDLRKRVQLEVDHVARM